MHKLLVNSRLQTAELWLADRLVKRYKISTAANGLGCEVNSYCTPTGRLRVAQKVGEGLPVGTVFKSRRPTGELWSSNKEFGADDDLILTRILWLEGLDDNNRNTFERYIYLHGTNHEEKLGRPASQGCIRFSNRDILEVFESLQVGSEVIIE